MKKVLKVLAVALLSVSIMGALFGCFKEDIKSVSVNQQQTANVTQDNFTVIYNYTTEEWIALSDSKKIDLATKGYERAVEELEAKASSNFNISGLTSAGDSGSATAVVFALDHDTSKIKVYSGEGSAGQSSVISEVDVKYPLS